jgi:hypothetical protein
LSFGGLNFLINDQPKGIKTKEKAQGFDSKTKVRYLACFEHVLHNTHRSYKAVKTQETASKVVQKSNWNT